MESSSNDRVLRRRDRESRPRTRVCAGLDLNCIILPSSPPSSSTRRHRFREESRSPSPLRRVTRSKSRSRYSTNSEVRSSSRSRRFEMETDMQGKIKIADDKNESANAAAGRGRQASFGITIHQREFLSGMMGPSPERPTGMKRSAPPTSESDVGKMKRQCPGTGPRPMSPARRLKPAASTTTTVRSLQEKSKSSDTRQPSLEEPVSSSSKSSRAQIKIQYCPTESTAAEEDPAEVPTGNDENSGDRGTAKTERRLRSQRDPQGGGDAAQSKDLTDGGESKHDTSDSTNSEDYEDTTEASGADDSQLESEDDGNEKVKSRRRYCTIM